MKLTTNDGKTYTGETPVDIVESMAERCFVADVDDAESYLDWQSRRWFDGSFDDGDLDERAERFLELVEQHDLGVVDRVGNVVDLRDAFDDEDD